MNSPVSPVNNTSDVSLVDTFQSSDVIKIYKDQFDINVAAFFKEESFSLYQCTQTGYRFYYPRGMDGDGNFYDNLHKKLGDGYYHDWKFENELAYKNIKAAEKILDIGCGTGKFLLKAKQKAGEVCGLELNNKAVDICKANGLEVFNEMIGVHAAKKEGYYDMVCMFQVLEHIYDVKSFLEDSLKALKTGGTLVIGVPNNEPYFNNYDKYSALNMPPHHMGLWNRKVFENLAALFNLKIKAVEYDVKGRIAAWAYLKAKYMCNIISPPGQHSISEKVKLNLMLLITVPLAVLKKMTSGINGAHIAVVFEKL